MEPLLDPEGDRVMKDIIPPPHRPLADDLLYPNKGTLIIRSHLLFFSIQCSKLGAVEVTPLQGR
jgi:hypothetical protein